MRRPAARRSVVIVPIALVTFSLGMTAAVSVARPASAAPPKTKAATTPGSPTTPKPPKPVGAARFFVLNATVNAASDHEIVGSSAFPNFATGAVDNYYSLAHSHVDNSPFAQGTASPADTGPVGQTAAAGNTQQPQYADARWPGGPDKATYGDQGGPYAHAKAGEFNAAAAASEASLGMSGTSSSSTIAVPKGLKDRLRQALAAWKATWPDRLHPRPKSPVPRPKLPKPALPKPALPTPAPPTPTVPTPIATVTTPGVTVGGLPSTPPPAATATAPNVTVPSLPDPTAASSRSLAAASGGATPADGASLLESSTEAAFDLTTDALVTSGESRLGRVSIGGGQIVLEGIHVFASITNDGTAPTHKVAITVASATIGGIPVTIDQDGVHLADQHQALPYQQASDALNAALKQAGIRLFLVSPEITSGACADTGADTGAGSGGGTGTSTGAGTTSDDQSGMDPSASSCGQTGMCDQAGTGTGTGTDSTTTTPALTDSTTGTTTTSCAETCDQAGTGTGTGTGTTATTTPTTTSSGRFGTTGTTSTTGTTGTTGSCGDMGFTDTTGSCRTTGTGAGATTGFGDQPAMTSTTSPGDPMGMGVGTASSAETVRATGVHLVFAPPVSQPGVPAQYVEHILGEVYVDSLAVPGSPADFDLLSSSSSSPYSSPYSSPSSSFSSCLGGRHSGKTSFGASSGGGSSSSGSAAGSISSSGSASGFGAGSQPAAGSTGMSLPAAFAAALRKPVWLLLAYLVWQSLVIGTGASLWNWRREAS